MTSFQKWMRKLENCFFFMFSFRRYFAVGSESSQAASATDSDQNGSPPSPRTQAVIEMVATNRSPVPVIVGTAVPQVVYATPDTEYEDALEESFEDDEPSSTALAAIRLCVWAFFLLDSWSYSKHSKI